MSVVNVLRSRVSRSPELGERDAAWYDQVYQATEEYRGHYTGSRYYFLWCVVVDRIMRANIRSVLDIGCGPGQFAAFLRDKGLKHYYGLDLSEECVELARSACPEFNFLAASVFETDLLEKLDYDAVVSLEFLEHVEEDIRVLSRIRPGTTFFGTVPSFPYISHVRHFSTCGEVSRRYGGMFREFRVDSLLADQNGKQYYLFEGLKS